MRSNPSCILEILFLHVHLLSLFFMVLLCILNWLLHAEAVSLSYVSWLLKNAKPVKLR